MDLSTPLVCTKCKCSRFDALVWKKTRCASCMHPIADHQERSSMMELPKEQYNVQETNVGKQSSKKVYFYDTLEVHRSDGAKDGGYLIPEEEGSDEEGEEEMESFTDDEEEELQRKTSAKNSKISANDDSNYDGVGDLDMDELQLKREQTADTLYYLPDEKLLELIEDTEEIKEDNKSKRKDEDEKTTSSSTADHGYEEKLSSSSSSVNYKEKLTSSSSSSNNYEEKLTPVSSPKTRNYKEQLVSSGSLKNINAYEIVGTTDTKETKETQEESKSSYRPKTIKRKGSFYTAADHFPASDVNNNNAEDQMKKEKGELSAYEILASCFVIITVLTDFAAIC